MGSSLGTCEEAKEKCGWNCVYEQKFNDEAWFVEEKACLGHPQVNCNAMREFATSCAKRTRDVDDFTKCYRALSDRRWTCEYRLILAIENVGQKWSAVYNLYTYIAVLSNVDQKEIILFVHNKACF